MTTPNPITEDAGIPTTSPSPDFYGALRPGNAGHADSVVALRGKTGEFVWGF